MIKRLLLLLAPLALTGCDKPLFAPPIREAKPALWLVQDDDTKIYLFGTVHVLKPGYRWISGEVEKGFGASDQVVLELLGMDRDEKRLIVDKLVLNKGPRLSQRFAPADLARIRAGLERYDLKLEYADRLAPWYVAVMLSSIAVTAAGHDPNYGVEAMLLREAKLKSKQVTGLETAYEQFGYFAQLSPQAQEALLLHTVDNLPQLNRTADAAAEAWVKGDPDALARLMNADLKDSPELAEKLVRVRNRHWADWIKARMEKPGKVFFAVGAGHLAGSDSLQAELAARGYKVVRLQ